MSIRLNRDRLSGAVLLGWQKQDVSQLTALYESWEYAVARSIRNEKLAELREHLSTLNPDIRVRRLKVAVNGSRLGPLATWRAVLWMPSEESSGTGTSDIEAEFDAAKKKARSVANEAGLAVNAAINGQFGSDLAGDFATATEDSLPRFVSTPASRELPPLLEAEAHYLIKAADIHDYETAQLYPILQWEQQLNSPKTFPDL